MSERKAAFAERAIKFLKQIRDRDLEDHRKKFVLKLQQFVSTLNSRKNRSNGSSPRDMKNNDFLSILCKKLLMK